jgi:hypothetical protein
MPKGIDVNVVLSVASLLVTLFVLAVQLGFWGGGVSARTKPTKPDDDNGESTPGRLRKVIADIEGIAKDARAIAHDARNIANMTDTQTAAIARQVERDLERVYGQLQENTRRIDELWRVMRSGEGT